MKVEILTEGRSCWTSMTIEMTRTRHANGPRKLSWTGGLWRKFAKPVRAHLHAYYTGKGARLE